MFEQGLCVREESRRIRAMSAGNQWQCSWHWPLGGLDSAADSPWTWTVRVHEQSVVSVSPRPRTGNGHGLSAASPRSRTVRGQSANSNSPGPWRGRKPAMSKSVDWPRMSESRPNNVHTCCRQSFRIVRLENLELSAATNARSVLTVLLRPRGHALPVRSSRAAVFNA